MNIHLSVTIVVPDMAPSLLSISALTKKDISVIFVPGKALLVDLEDNISVLGTAVRADDGL